MASKAAALTVQVAIVGGGPAGLTAAIALAEADIETALIARAAGDDHRTTALLAGSVTALDTLGVWARCRPHAAALKTMRIIDDTSRLIRAPEVSFAADEIGLDAFGYNIANRHLYGCVERARERTAFAQTYRRRSAHCRDRARIKSQSSCARTGPWRRSS